MQANKHEQNETEQSRSSELDLTPVFQKVGLPYKASATLAFETKYQLQANSTSEFYELLWGVHLALRGDIPARWLRASRGKALLLELPLLQTERLNEDAKFVICFENNSLRLLLPDEFEEPSRQKVLVAENDAIISIELNRTLSRAGFDVTLARTGAGTLDLAHKEYFDLALVDVDLRDIHGFELCVQLHSDPATRDLRVVICSAWQGAGHLAKQAGAIGYLEKPDDFGSLPGRIRQILGLPPATDELHAP